MRFIAIFFVFLLAMVQLAYGASAGDRALAWAESQRNAALGSVVIAQNRVEAAESGLMVSRNVERDISNSKDSAAMSIAREAVAVSEQGLVEARTLLKRARALLSRQENTIAAIKKFIAENNNHKALVIPVEGEVRHVFSNGAAYSSDDITAPLRFDERVEVGPGGSARLFVAGGNAEIALSENSNFTFTRNQADDSFEALLSEGFGRIRTMSKNHFKKFEVRTPAGTSSIRGTDFSVKTSATLTRIEVFEGVVLFSPVGGGKSVEVDAGKGLDILKDGGIQPVKPLDNQPRENPWNENVRLN